MSRLAFLVLLPLVLSATHHAPRAAGAGLAQPEAEPEPVSCPVDGTVAAVEGTADAGRAKSYELIPFEVPAGTTRVEVGYRWANQSDDPPASAFDDSVVDLGLWDEDGYRDLEGFRGWSGSREGRLHEDEDPIWVQADSAERGYRPGPVEAGTWYVELGLAAIHTSGVAYEVEVSCSTEPVGEAFVPQSVDPLFVADATPGWFHGDFHMHGYHSNSSAPEWDDADPSDIDSFVDFARAAELDFAPVTDYVTTQHWSELGPIQESNPDLLIWPGREVITYFGHGIVLGETTSADYRHGFEDVSLPGILEDARSDGALVGIAHPTHFEPPLDNLCRGCALALVDEIDWGLVDTIEVLTGPKAVVDAVPELAGADPTLPQPFIATATAFWEARLMEGHRITAVSGSDDKLGPFLGSSATAVYANALSVAGLTEAIRAGHAFVKLDGVTDSPHLELVAQDAAGTVGMMGDAFAAPSVDLSLTITNGTGQDLRISRDGVEVERVAIAADPFEYEWTATTTEGSGPLGTFWRVDTIDPTNDAPTTISNPVFVGAPEDRLGPIETSEPSTSLVPPGGGDSRGGFPVGAAVAGALMVVLASVGAVVAARRRTAEK